MIYLDNASTSVKKPKAVLQAVTDAMTSFGNPGRGVHDASLNAARIIYDTREKLAALLHAEAPSRIAFTSNATESLNLAIKGLLNPGDHVITTVLEHNSVLRPLYEMEQQGVSVTIIPCDSFGNPSYDLLESAIRQETKAIICTGSSNLTGNLVDLARIRRIARMYELFLIVDGAQLVGHIPVDVQKMGIDILCFTGHKALFGPQGTGGIYVRTGISLRPLKTGGIGFDSYSRRHPISMPEALEAGTQNSHGIAGLNAGVTFLLNNGIEQIHSVEQRLTRRLYEGLCTIPGVKIYGDFSTWNRCPVVSINVCRLDSGEVSNNLLVNNQIATRAGAHCAPLMHEALGTAEQGAVRFSPSYFNTEQEIDCAIEAVRVIAKEATSL